uniref:Uncharacterized protein n=1 Tax=Trichogramma kaykai TaxID=54128 RepID=A0ABD2WUL2_9HYME
MRVTPPAGLQSRRNLLEAVTEKGNLVCCAAGESCREEGTNSTEATLNESSTIDFVESTRVRESCAVETSVASASASASVQWRTPSGVMAALQKAGAR